jgi:hypothetical protein
VLYFTSRQNASDLRAHRPGILLALLSDISSKAMHSGSDSDPFDEGDLTARGRRAKGKGGARASEKAKQKPKDVRPNATTGTATPFG